MTDQLADRYDEAIEAAERFRDSVSGSPLAQRLLGRPANRLLRRLIGARTRREEKLAARTSIQTETTRLLEELDGKR
jgi:hypothetical protein